MVETMGQGGGWTGDDGPDREIDRRGWLKLAMQGLAVAGLSPLARGGDEGPGGKALIVRSRRPLDLETPVEWLDSWLTPSDVFFVRSHFGEPAVGLFPWATEVVGLVERPLNLTLHDLGGFETRRVTAVLQCSGNGRAYFRPRMPGVGWEKGAVGQAEWSGVRLTDVLERAGLKYGAAHVHLLGADGPPSPKTPLFLRSLPLEKALHPDTILATRMNGEPLPVAHGGPVRLVAPGWAGNNWMKWVRRVTVSAVEAPGFYMQTGYRMPRSPVPPGGVVKPADLIPVTMMNVKSLITFPPDGSKRPAGPVEVRGIAWTGEGVVETLEVGVGRGPDRAWKPATFVDEPRPWCWRRWRFRTDVGQPGAVILSARASDSRGQTQPEISPHNRSGYLWNGIDHVTFEAT